MGLRFLKISIVSPEKDFGVMQFLVMFQLIFQIWRIHNNIGLNLVIEALLKTIADVIIPFPSENL